MAVRVQETEKSGPAPEVEAATGSPQGSLHAVGLASASESPLGRLRRGELIRLQPIVGNRALTTARAGGARAQEVTRAAAPGTMDSRLERLMGGTIQAKRHELSRPDEPAEREADEFAERIVTGRGSAGAGEPPRAASPSAPVARAADGAGGGAAPPEFTGALARARSGGRPLPGGFRRRAETGMRADFRDVRVHDDADADALSGSIAARAFTSGTDIFFGRGQYDPGSAGGQRLLAHELTHVAQQRRGPGLNRIHRVISVGGKEYAGWRIRGSSSDNVQKAWQRIKASAHVPADGWTDAHLERLTLWITREKSYSIQVWMTQRNYEFSNWTEAAEALDAETRAQANRVREKALAKTAKRDNPAIQRGLAAALRSVATWISAAYPGHVVVQDRAGSRIVDSVWAHLEAFRGQYSHWYPGGHVEERMTNPVEKRLSSNFVILREVVYALDRITHVNVEDTEDAVTAQAAHGSYDDGPRYGTGADGRVRVDKEDPHETRGEHFTPKRSHPWVQYARAKAMPLRAGASNTTDRILQMAGKAGVGVQGKQAIAWAGFIFWNTRYYNTISPPHTFHEIMDVANVNHNVPYNVDDPYKFTQAEAEEEAPVSDVPDYATQDTVTLVDRTAQQDEPQDEQEEQEAPQVDADQFRNIPPDLNLGRPVFTAGKTMMASKTEDGALSQAISFVERPGSNPTELPLQMFKVLCSPSMRAKGRAHLQPAGFGERSYFVALADLFDLTTGQFILT